MSQTELKTPPLCLAFIDPIISPIYLTKTLRRYPLKLVAVFSLTQLSEEEKKRRFRPELFDHVIYVNEMADRSPHAIAEALKKLGVQYVFYGYEASVPLADEISQLVCPTYANNPKTSLTRCDKYEMQEALRKAGVPYVKQMKVINKSLTPNQIEALNTWDFPVMVKPTRGVVSTGTKECHSIQEIIALIKTEHILLHAAPTENFTIQERLIGTEYFVDTVSLRGEHRVVSVYRYKKINYKGHPIYRHCEAIDPRQDEWKACSDYIVQVLNATDFQNGFAHSELFLTAKGPRLVEINPRISGASGFVNRLTHATLKTNQPRVLWETLTQKPYAPPVKLFRYGFNFLLQNWNPHKIRRINAKALKALPSYYDHLMLKSPGTYLESPKILSDTVAFVLLINANKEQLLKDYDKLLELEKSNQLF